MNISIQETDSRIIATLCGEMDTAAAQEAEEALAPLLNSKGKDILIDCTDLEYISSSGLRILLRILKQAQASGSRVILKNVNDVIRDVLNLTGFMSIFEFE